MKSTNRIRAASLALLVGVVAVPSAFAEGADTNAGQDVVNTATVNYQVGGLDQAPVQGSDTFETDRKINLTVVETAFAAGGTPAYNANPANGNVTGTPGSVQYLYYKVTNLTNGPIDIRLIFDNEADGTLGPDGVDLDTENTSSNAVFVDSGVLGVFEPGTDGGVAFLNNVPEDGEVYVWVRGTLPVAPDGSVAVGSLIAVASADGTLAADPSSPLAQAGDYGESGTESANTVDTVLADAAGAFDAVRDGRSSDEDAWEVSTAALTVSKSSILLTDPINCTIAGDPASCGTNVPKRIPGAVVQYCVDVNNTGSSDATSIVVSDPLPTQTAFVSGSIRTAVSGAAAACDTTSGTLEDDNATDDGGDEADPDGGSHDGGTPGTVSIVTPTVAGGTRYKTRFWVTIN